MAEEKEKSPIEKGHWELNIKKSLKINGKIIPIEVTSMEIKKELNGHGLLNLILYKKDNENLTDFVRDNTIEVYAVSRDESNNFLDEKPIFKGFMDKITIENNSVNIVGKSFSALLDRKPIYRIYQNTHHEEQALYDTIKEAYTKDNAEPKLTITLKKDGNSKGKNKTDEKEFYLQYDESYWEFIKRVSSLTGLPLMAKESTSSKDKSVDLLVGFKDLDENSKRGNIDTIHDVVKVKRIMELETYYVLSFNGMMNLGDYINIDKDGKDYLVYKMVVKYNKENNGQTLGFEYFVKDKMAYKRKGIKNSKFVGRAIVAKVVAQGKDKNNGKVALNFRFGDVIQEEPVDKCSFIPYTSLYSGENTGSNFTPALESFVNVYFPSEREKDAFVRDSLIEIYNEKYHNVNMKTLITGTDDKSVGLIMSEEGQFFKLAGNNAGTGKESSVYLKVKDGGITIKANNDEVVMILDKEKIHIKNKESFITVNDSAIGIQSGSKSKVEVQDGKMLIKSGSSMIEVKDGLVSIKSPKTESSS